MKIPLKLFLFGLALAAGVNVACAQGTAFNYNGDLISGGSPANGNYDFQFAIYDAASGGTKLAGPSTASGIGVTNGLFVVTLDFGSGIFTGGDRWLDIAVRPSGGGSFTPLGPRQKFTASPYAIYSGQAANATAVASSSVGVPQLATLGPPGAGQVLGYDGSSLVWANASTPGWLLSGNSGTTPGANFLGTIDSQALELKVNNSRAWRLEPASSVNYYSVNVVGGHSANNVGNGVIGGTIAGGGGFSFLSFSDLKNQVSADWGTIGGGNFNFVGASYGTVPGGTGNQVQGVGSFAAGQLAHATHDGTFVWCDGTQTGNSTGPNRFEVYASGDALFHSTYVRVTGLGGELAYIGGDGAGNDVQIGSLNPLINGVSFYNASSGTFMDAVVRTLTILGGADLAEPFEMSHEDIPQGSVVVIDDEQPGQLKLSRRPYDTRVAGVVSGANGIRPGISVRQEGSIDEGQNVALSGRVYVLADASNGAIHPGDLLTTSGTPGRAMKVTDHTRAQGAILGKAMSRLEQGRGMVLMLVTLQ